MRDKRDALHLDQSIEDEQEKEKKESVATERESMNRNCCILG